MTVRVFLPHRYDPMNDKLVEVDIQFKNIKFHEHYQNGILELYNTLENVAAVFAPGQWAYFIEEKDESIS